MHKGCKFKFVCHAICCCWQENFHQTLRYIPAQLAGTTRMVKYIMCFIMHSLYGMVDELLANINHL